MVVSGLLKTTLRLLYSLEELAGLRSYTHCYNLLQLKDTDENQQIITIQRAPTLAYPLHE